MQVLHGFLQCLEFAEIRATPLLKSVTPRNVRLFATEICPATTGHEL